MDRAVSARRTTYAGLFTVTLATLMYEVLLTRIFSVTMWYHFAFIALSVAMFGMTVGAILVYLFPTYFTEEKVKYHLSLSSLLFTVSIVFSFLTHIIVPAMTAPTSWSIGTVYSLAFTYLVLSVPFVFSGICVCLVLTKFPRQVSTLYAADLAGAALGCILSVLTLKVTDGPTAVIVVAFFACFGSVLFASEIRRPRLLRISGSTCLLLALFAAGHTVLVHRQSALLRLLWVKDELDKPHLYEKWNSFSRIAVDGDPNQLSAPYGWGLSSTIPTDRRIRQLWLHIDASAGTVLTAFDGDLRTMEHLKYDITNLVHHVRQNASVLVIGAGGGRDILSALAFGQKSVVAVEINGDISATVNEVFGDFTGHLDRHPKVRFVCDEARSYIAGLDERFDIIQASLTDTWAATAAGAFVLTENALYTVEAWRVLLDRLAPEGVLTFSRWYHPGSPGEVYRLTSLACTSLAQMGVTDPRKHIIIVARPTGHTTGSATLGVGTILVGMEPFSDEDLDAIEEVVGRMQFELVLTPRFARDKTFERLTSPHGLDALAAGFPMNIAAPTDDCPFFFHMLRLRDAFNSELIQKHRLGVNLKAVRVLAVLLIIMVVLTFLCILVPLILTTDRAALKGAVPLLLFFSCIGFGFMLIEIYQMQRLIVFLGHPIYGLSVVLFTLLLSSGCGSYATQRIVGAALSRSAMLLLGALICALAVFGILTPHAVSAFAGSQAAVRIAVAIATLFPLGLFMGMPFPLGMMVASRRSAVLTPWLWGLNGATSVCASVVGVAIAMGSGISTSFWTGCAFYVGALGAFAWATRAKA